jgi:hypothetical protein
MTRHAPRSGFWPGVALSVAILVSGLAILELGLRAFWIKRLTVSAGIEHPHFHHRPRASHTYHYTSKANEFDVRIRTNSRGLRGPDPAIPKPAGTVRILMLGDSFTFGFPVRDEETFVARIEQGLRAQGLPVEVVNGGVSGYSPTLHYLLLRDELFEVEPDLVVLWYDFGDLQEDHQFQKNLIYDAAGRIVRCDPRYVNGRFDWGEWLRNRSALAKYVYVKGIRTFEKISTLGLGNYVRAKLRGERAKVAIARLKSEQGSADAGASDRFLLFREYATPESVAPFWELNAKYLRMIRDLLAERDIPFMLGVYPYGMVVGPEQWDAGRGFWGFERGKTYDASLGVSLFTAFSRDEDVPLINAIDRFKEAGGREALFYDVDGHFTPAGHRVLAEHALTDRRFLELVHRLAGR